MCLIAFAWKAHAEFPLIVAANRDEWRDRAAAPAHWWPDRQAILAGRDLKAGGTWLGVTRAGRFAAITNFRDPTERDSSKPSRGAMVIDFLESAVSPRDFLAALAPGAQRYNAFNLLLGDGRSLCYFGSREGEILDVPPGVHALSNHLLDEPWPKVTRAKAGVEDLLTGGWRDGGLQPFFDVVSDTTGVADEALPDTGVGIEFERVLAPILIRGERYGTRCSTVVAFDQSGHAQFEERTRGPDGAVTGTEHFTFSSVR